MKIKYNIVFVVLTYRNTDDLEFFLKSNNINDSKVVVVNSYFDDSSQNKFREIASQHDCDFLPVENKGYSFGNNIGINHAVEHYDFNYLIISNADIEIKKFDLEFLEGRKSVAAVYGPTIRTLTGKHQNPFIVRHSKILRRLFYTACLSSNNFQKKIVYALNKLDRLLFLCYTKLFIGRILFRVYSCHGSFIIINKKVLDKKFLLFNEDMFLFQEEHFFARQCALHKVPIYYLKDQISIKHFEDGSASSIKDKIIKFSEESYIIYYKYFNKEA